MSGAMVGRAALTAPSHGFSRVMKVIHWATAFLLVAAYALAWSIDGAQTREQAAWLVMMHRSFGLSVLLLTLFRLGWRQTTRVPPLPPATPKMQRTAAKAVLISLYVLSLLQPLLGLVASQFHGDHIRVFGLFELPQFLSTDRPLSRQLFLVHGSVALAFLFVLAMHVMAALHHHFIARDDVLRGMLPGRQASARVAESDMGSGRSLTPR